mgnify:CR=1 FL=1
MPEDWEHGGFGLYIHWPFCQAKCPYCDFNSHVVAQIDQAAWRDAYLIEIDRIGAETQGRVLKSVFFGGGTPSMMDPDLVDAILTKVRATWPMANDIEITLEANPTSVEAGRFVGYRDAGVNRVSMGIQALNDKDLRALGRLHTTQEALTAFSTARETFDRVSFDLIYARPGQSIENWRSELAQALEFGTDHLSLYQLTIEPGTRFETLVRKGELIPADDDHAADLFELTQDITTAAGLPAYETSNHAKLGQESRHNLTYWRYDDYAGIGPGAHGRRLKMATERHKKPENYLSGVERNGHGIKIENSLSPKTQAMEALLMGLRLVEGIDLADLEVKTGLAADQMIDDHERTALTDLGFVKQSGSNISVLRKGMPLLDAILPRLVSDTLA